MGRSSRSRPGTEPAEFVHSVITNEQATRAYLSYWDLGTVILDISDPAHPEYLGRTNAPASHSAAIGRAATYSSRRTRSQPEFRPCTTYPTQRAR